MYTCIDMGGFTPLSGKVGSQGFHGKGGSQGVHKKGGGSREPCEPPGYGPEHPVTGIT